MFSKPKISNFLKNAGYAFLAQGISLSFSIVTSLIFPKVLGIREFGFWQLFLFYTTYVGVFNLGLIDGIYLKTGGKEYSELNFGKINGQFNILIIMITFFALFIVIGQRLVPSLTQERRYVLICMAIYTVLANASWFIEYILQATYKIKQYAFATIIDKTIFLILMTVGICFFSSHFVYFPAIYLVSRFISFLYLAGSFQEIVRWRGKVTREMLLETWDLIKIGINLTVSSISGMLILGINRKVIDIRWGIEGFGKFSLAISLCNFFLVFIQQISKVLFPVLRRMDSADKTLYYGMLRTFLNVLLPFCFVLYIPVKMILELWLPQYEESFQYLSFLLPICLFDGKMQLLCNTYFKVLRQEKFLLGINLFSMALSMAGAVLGGWVFGNMQFIMISMVAAIAVRSMISECYMEKCLARYDGKARVSPGLEVLFAGLFIMTAWNMNDLATFFIISLSYILYLIFYRKDINALSLQLKAQFAVK